MAKVTIRVLTYKMAAKINWHRCGTKLRHCHNMYTHKMANVSWPYFPWRQFTLYVFIRRGSLIFRSCAFTFQPSHCRSQRHRGHGHELTSAYCRWDSEDERSSRREKNAIEERERRTRRKIDRRRLFRAYWAHASRCYDAHLLTGYSPSAGTSPSWRAPVSFLLLPVPRWMISEYKQHNRPEPRRRFFSLRDIIHVTSYN